MSKDKNSESVTIENILLLKKPLLFERNKILDNPIKYYFFKKKLREIDEKLDALDLQLYAIETKDSIKESDLNEMVLAAEKKLKEFSKYFT